MPTMPERVAALETSERLEQHDRRALLRRLDLIEKELHALQMESSQMRGDLQTIIDEYETEKRDRKQFRSLVFGSVLTTLLGLTGISVFAPIIQHALGVH